MTRADLLIEILGEAMQRPTAEREGYIHTACADPDDKKEAMRLLMALGRAGRFMDGPVVPWAAVKEGPGSIIGRYTLVEQIGEGGFGVVFRAEQREPVHRMVALKIIKLGMDTRAVVARFEAERQALAMMDHPCIAKVHDAGATDTGRPYFVMELVQGQPITRFCSEARLPPERRLELFVDVCRAVQHAHTKGIIHRDLKPANILVSEVDGRPLPRVIDFGIAKATGDAGKEAVTEARQFVGTPEYMSPEQAQSPAVDIDTRTDIYSLGVLLYELLTGATPLSGAELRSAAWDQMLRMIRETDPPRPSTRALTPPDRPGAIPDATVLRGDLDWIIMRCLEKDRARRYQTADALAADIERHMRGEPVLAAPPSRVYRLSKFVRRHRVGVAAGGLAAASLLAGLGVALWQARIAGLQRDAAEASRQETALVAAFQAARLEELDPQLMGARLSEDLLKEAGAAWAGPGELAERLARFEADLAGLNLTNVALASLDRNIFQRTVAAIDKEFAGRPRIQGELLRSTGWTMNYLGLEKEAVVHLKRALELLERERGPDDPLTLGCAADLGLAQLGTGDLDGAEASLGRAIVGQRRLLGEDHKDTLMTLAVLASVEKARGHLPQAEEGYRRVLTRLERAGPAADPVALIKVLSDLAVTEMGRNNLKDAEPHARRALELSRATQGDENVSTLASLSNLASILHESGDLPGATVLAREALETTRRVFGNRHPTFLVRLNNLAVLLSQQRQFDEAEPLQREVFEREREMRGSSDAVTLTAANNLGMLLLQRGSFEQAAEVLGEGARASLSGGDAARPMRAVLLHHHADALQLLGRLDEAKGPAEEAVRMYRENSNWSAGEANHAVTVLAWILTQRGEGDEVVSLFEPLLDQARHVSPPDEAALASVQANLGYSLLVLRRYDQAEAVMRECVGIRARIFSEGKPGRWRYFQAESLLGGALTGQAADAGAEREARLAKLREAEALVLRAHGAMKDDATVPAPAMLATKRDLKADSLQRVIDLYETWAAVEPGQGHDARAAQWRSEREKRAKPDLTRPLKR